MGDTTRWLLPSGIDEFLPEQAGRIEHCRRDLLDTCAGWGYEYVVPPLVEFTDSLLVGIGSDLEILTCKFPDRDTGKTLAVRADITPQVARIDAHSLGQEGVTRLCYSGSTLKSVANSIPADRSPVQLGAELFGCADIGADIEIVDLLLSLASRSGMTGVTFDIGHAAFCDLVLDTTRLEAAQKAQVMELMARKANSEIARFIATVSDSLDRDRVSLLSGMYGGRDVLERARSGFSDVPGMMAVIDDLEAVIESCERAEDIDIFVDLTEAHGYKYHSGVVFALYARELGAPIAKGGRYDRAGEIFGRSRPATGFAIDLKAWAALATVPAVSAQCVASPVSDCVRLLEKESELRAAGAVVIKSLGDVFDPRCNQQLVKTGTEWLLRPMENQ